ncbi:hypothetical protein JCM10908_000634 [Rhodotorula pacifica]|uniref:uncharacterized protein n=1 Tax=Rhodotorula pacifica TaxID=1495444 RepID=UPI00316F4699
MSAAHDTLAVAPSVSRVPALPAELVRLFLNHLTRDMVGPHAPHRLSLLPLARVCKMWAQEVYAVVYEEVWIDTDTVDKFVPALLHAPQNILRIRSLTIEFRVKPRHSFDLIRMLALEHDRLMDPLESDGVVHLLSQATNLRHLAIPTDTENLYYLSAALRAGLGDKLRKLNLCVCDNTSPVGNCARLWTTLSVFKTLARLDITPGALSTSATFDWSGTASIRVATLELVGGEFQWPPAHLPQSPFLATILARFDLSQLSDLSLTNYGNVPHNLTPLRTCTSLRRLAIKLSAPVALESTVPSLVHILPSLTKLEHLLVSTSPATSVAVNNFAVGPFLDSLPPKVVTAILSDLHFGFDSSLSLFGTPPILPSEYANAQPIAALQVLLPADDDALVAHNVLVYRNISPASGLRGRWRGLVKVNCLL